MAPRWRVHRDVAASVDALLRRCSREGRAEAGVADLAIEPGVEGGMEGGAGWRGGDARRPRPLPLVPPSEVRWLEQGSGRMMVEFESAEAERRALGAQQWNGR